MNVSGIEFQLSASTIDIKGNLVQESSNSLALTYFSSLKEGKLNFEQLVFFHILERESYGRKLFRADIFSNRNPLSWSS